MIDESVLTGQQQKSRARKVAASSTAFDQALNEGTSRYQDTLARLTNPQTAQSTKAADLRQIDAALQSGKAYEADLQELIGDLTEELESLGQRVTTVRDQTGMEKFVGIFSKERAAKMMRDRIRQQNVAGSMKTVLAYAQGTVQALTEAIAKNQRAYAEISTTRQEISEKLQAYQPKYEEWQAKVEALKAKKAELERDLQAAGPDQFAATQKQLTDLQAELDQAEINRHQYFQVVTNAREALPIVNQHMEGFKQSIAALTQNRVRVQQRIANLTSVFTNIYVIMETALDVKGFSRIDQAINYTADATTRVMNEQLAGILDETATRAETALIDPAKLEQYIAHMGEIVTVFDERMKALRDDYAEPDPAP